MDLDRITEVLRSESTSEWEALAGEIQRFPHGRNKFDEPWILVAVGCGSLACVRWMLDAGVEIDFRDATGSTVLSECIERRDEAKYEILDLLLGAGADVDAFGFNGWAPLHLAAVRNDKRAAEMLLKADADKELRTSIDDCATAAEEAASAGHHEMARFIRDWPGPR